MGKHTRRSVLAGAGTAGLASLLAGGQSGQVNDILQVGDGGPIRNWGIGQVADRPDPADSHLRDVWIATDGPNYIFDGSDWQAISVGSSSDPVPEGHFDSVNTDVLNNAQFVDAGDWDDALQDAIDAADGDGGHVFVYGNGEPSKSVEVPSHVTLMAWGEVKLTPPTDHSLDSQTEAGRDYRYLITNSDHENGNGDVTVEGFDIDFSNVSHESKSHAPVWFHDCNESKQINIDVSDVVYSDGGSGDTRQFGVFMSDCTDSEQVDCDTERVGYDGVAMRGTGEGNRIENCTAIDIPGTGIQVTGHADGSPADIHDEFEIIDCETDGQLYVHAFGSGTADAILKNNDAYRIGVLADGEVDNIVLRENVTDRTGVTVRDTVYSVSILDHIGRDDGWPMVEIGASSSGTLDILRIDRPFSRGTSILKNSATGGANLKSVSISEYVYDGSGQIVDESEATDRIQSLTIQRSGSIDAQANSRVESGVLEDWESIEAADEWHISRTLSHSIQSNTVIQGSQTLEFDSFNQTSGALVVSDILDIVRGYEYGFAMQADTASQAFQMHWMADTTPNVHDGDAYLTVIHFDNDEVQLAKRNNGSFSLIQTDDTVSLSADTTYYTVFRPMVSGRVEVEFFDGTGSIALLGVEDDDFDSGNVGFRVFNGDGSTTSYFDWLTRRPFQ